LSFSKYVSSDENVYCEVDVLPLVDFLPCSLPRLDGAVDLGVHAAQPVLDQL
jgi:hypothetical protein